MLCKHQRHTLALVPLLVLVLWANGFLGNGFLDGESFTGGFLANGVLSGARRGASGDGGLFFVLHRAESDGISGQCEQILCPAQERHDLRVGQGVDRRTADIA